MSKFQVMMGTQKNQMVIKDNGAEVFLSTHDLPSSNNQNYISINFNVTEEEANTYIVAVEKLDEIAKKIFISGKKSKQFLPTDTDENILSQRIFNVMKALNNILPDKNFSITFSQELSIICITPAKT